MVSEWVLNERMSEMEQIVWSDFIIIIVTFIAMGWFFWSVYIRNKKKGMMNEKSNTHFCPLHCPCPSFLTIIQWGVNIYNPHKLTPQSSHILVNQTKFWYIMGSPKTNQLGNQVKHLLIILSILLLSSPVIGQETGVLCWGETLKSFSSKN